MLYRNLKVARKAIVDEIGKGEVKALHHANRVADIAIMIALPTVFLSNAVALATMKFSPLWVVLFIAQGFIIPWFQFIPHDFLVHRKIGGKYNNVLGFLYLLPMQHSFTWFRLFHEQHHRWVGSDRDAEAYKQDLDTRWKKLLFLTFVGVKLAMARKFKPKDGDQGATIDPTEREIVLIRREKWAVRILFATVVALGFVWHGIWFGYLLPLLIVVPVVSGFRVIMEHAEANDKNLYHTGVYYRTGPILDRLYLSNLGDSHIVHHLFQAIPFYRCKRVADMLNPLLVREAVVERRSVLTVLKGWFIDNQKHRQPWWTDEKLAAPESVHAPARVVMQAERVSDLRESAT